MQVKNLPSIDARYWTAIVAASMCGANMGDFVSRNLHLGHVRGLLPLLAVFLLVLWLEHRARHTAEAYYWAAILVLRTGATNLADLAVGDLKLGFPVAVSALAALMAAILLIDGRRGQQPTRDPRLNLPATDAPYWLAMLTAGTLGTALGDWVASGLGLALGSIVLAVVLGVTLLISFRVGGMAKPYYWLSIVAARTAGTTMGDFLASPRGLGLGLSVSLLCTGALLVGILVLWRGKKAGPVPIARPLP